MKRAPIIALFAANAISMVGNVLATVAIPWFVLQTTGSAAQTGITGFFTILPVIIAGLLGGALIDRLGYRPTSIIADIASGVTVALIPLLYFTVGLPFWQLMVLVFLGGLLDAPGTTARTALIPELAALAKMPLERATSVGQSIERGSRMLGAPLAGLLIPILGTANILWLDAASFAVSAGIVAALVTHVGSRPKETVPRAYFQEVMDGLRFVRSQAVVFSMLVILMITNFLDAAFSGVILPVYVKRIFDDPLSLGVLIAFWGGGAVLGGVVFGVIGHRLPRQAAFIGSFVLASLYSWSFALFLPFPVVLVAIAVSGIGAGPLNPIIDTVIFERVPADIRGRVLGTIMASAWVTMPLGVLIAGLVTEWTGLQPVLIGLGATYLATTLSMIFIPALRELNRRPPPQPLHP